MALGFRVHPVALVIYSKFIGVEVANLSEGQLVTTGYHAVGYVH
jgi:hypothetical protein